MNYEILNSIIDFSLYLAVSGLLIRKLSVEFLVFNFDKSSTDYESKVRIFDFIQ